MWKIGCTIFVVLVLCGCSASLPFVMAEALPGSYELKGSGQVALLTLNSDGTYTEIVRHGSGATETAKSNWKFERRSVVLEGFLIPAGLVPEGLFRFDDREIGERTAQGTIKSDFSLSPETTLSGRVKLYVDPDRAPAFEKTAGRGTLNQRSR